MHAGSVDSNGPAERSNKGLLHTFYCVSRQNMEIVTYRCVATGPRR